MGIKDQYISVEKKAKAEIKPEAAKPAAPAKQLVAKVNPASARGRKKNPNCVEAIRPWLAEGISRACWYARKRERKLFEEGIRVGREKNNE